MPFLDLNVERNGTKIKTTVYRKPTHSDRYLNFDSHHSIQNKKAVIRTLVNRALTHTSSSQDLEKELNHLKYILSQNHYPDKIVIDTINDCKRKFLIKTNNDLSEFDMTKVITIPYYRGLSESIREILYKQNIKTVFKRGFTIKNLLNPRKKDILTKYNVVYKVNCSDCDAVYVGTTKRLI